jgi:hypothetical protein
MEMWQMISFAVGGLLLLVYFKRRSNRLSSED